MQAIRLLSGPLSMFGMKAHIAALEKGLGIDLEMVSYSDKRGYYPKHPDVIRINPKQQVPVLIHGDLEIFDSTQIFEYLEDLRPEPALWPLSPAHRARARNLEHRSDEIYFSHIMRLMGLQNRLHESAAGDTIAAAADYYTQMERQLKDRSFLAGPFTYADIAFYIAQVFGERMGAKMTSSTPDLLAWRNNMAARASVRAATRPMVEFLDTNGRFVPDFVRAG